MGVRESVDRHPFVVTIVIFVFVASSAFMAWHSMASPRLDNKFKGYYSDDDGKSYFTDTFPKSVPFDHNGHQAYRVRVFRCGNGQPTVAWLESFPDDVNSSINHQTDPQARFVCFQSVSDRVLVKRPQGASWVSPPGQATAQPATGPVGREAHEYQDIITPPCSGASAEIVPGSNE